MAAALVALAGCAPAAAETPDDAWQPDRQPQPTESTGAKQDDVLSPAECEGSACGVRVGAIELSGFSEEELESVVTILEAMPPALTSRATFDVTRDRVDQADCPDPTRTPPVEMPPHCGYTHAESRGERSLLKLRDASFEALSPKEPRVAQELTSFAARDWYRAHADEVLATRRHESWQLGCYACPNDPDERCAALDERYGFADIMRDFESSTAATLLGERAWGGAGVRWTRRNGEPCTAAPRTDVLRARFVDDVPIVQHVQAIDVPKACGRVVSGVDYRLLANGSPDVSVKVALVETDGAQIFYPSVGAVPSGDVRGARMRKGLERLVAWADADFTLSFVACIEE
jgi:hypothetical protein